MMKKRILPFLTALAVGCMMLSCATDGSSGFSGDTEKVVYMLSESQPVRLTAAQKVFASDNNGFTLRFLKAMNGAYRSDRSFVYSPLSITYVLGMVNDGATGQTEQELEQTLGFHEGGIQAVNDYCKNLIDNLPKVDKDVTLDIANAVFLNKSYQLKEQFQKDMAEYYDARAEALDFSSPSTLGHINGWCHDKTKGMIPAILDKVDPDMVSYLLNAIYFKADWTSKFDPKNTKMETFTTAKGSTTLPMMRQDVLISYLRNDIYSAVKIPYGNGLWSMTVMLPEEGKTTDDVVNDLAANGFNDNMDAYMAEDAGFRPYEVSLKLPRYETSSDTEDIKDGLIGLLEKMGIRLAFNPLNEEICNICAQPVYIAMMRQKARVMVNEEGSEATAITVAGLQENDLAVPVEYPRATFHANRPFVYVIREASSGVILFVGKFTGE